MPDKGKIKERLFIAGVMLAFFLAFVLISQLAKQNSANHDDVKLKELQQIADETKTYPNFYLIDTNYGSKSVNAGVHKYYKSKANYDDVRAFYIDELVNKGWILSEESRQLIFKKQDLKIAIQHSNQVDGWNYAVSFVWRQE